MRIESELTDIYIRNTITQHLIEQSNQDYFLVKRVQVGTRFANNRLERTYDITYQAFDNLGDAEQNRCPDDILICRKDYTPASEEERQDLIRQIDDFLNNPPPYPKTQ